MDHHLCINTLIETSMEVKLLRKHLLSRQQQMLLAHQRERVISATDGSSSDADTLDTKKDALFNTLNHFEGTSELDRSLLIGLLKKVSRGKERNPRTIEAAVMPLEVVEDFDHQATENRPHQKSRSGTFDDYDVS